MFTNLFTLSYNFLNRSITHQTNYNSRFKVVWELVPPKQIKGGNIKSMLKWVMNIIRKKKFALLMKWCFMHLIRPIFFLFEKEGGRFWDFSRFDVLDVFAPSSNKIVNHMCSHHIFNVFSTCSQVFLNVHNTFLIHF